MGNKEMPMEERKQIAVPAVMSERWAVWLLAVMMLPLSAYMMACVLHIGFREGSYIGMLILMPSALAVLAAAVGSVAALLARMHLTPEAILLTLGGYTLRRIPSADIKLFCIAGQHSKQGIVYRLGISRKSLEELAGLQEKKMQRDPGMRYPLSLMKQKNNWQRELAGKYVKRKAQWNISGIFGRDILWMLASPEWMALLRTVYPEVAAEVFRETYTPAVAPWKDRDAARFCRGRVKENGQHGLTVFLMAFILSPLGLTLCFRGGLREGLVYSCIFALFFGILFGLLWHIERGEYDVVSLEPEAIRVHRGRKPYRTVPGKELKIIQANREMGGMAGNYLALTSLDREQILEKELARLQKTKLGRMTLAAWQQTEGWQERLFARHCTKKLNIWGWNSPEYLTIYATEQRIQSLREHYPEAEWIDICYEQYD